MNDIFLASNSPRRQEILKSAGFNVIVMPLQVDESVILEKNFPSAEMVERLAEYKNEAALSSILADGLVLTADTIVSFNDQILGKPHSKEEAFEMLLSLSGNTHDVFTGVCLSRQKSGLLQEKTSFVEYTKVFMNILSPQEIHAYIATKEPMDKAGAYGIQGIGGKFIHRIEGDFYNVMGLPLCKTYQAILKMQSQLD